MTIPMSATPRGWWLSLARGLVALFLAGALLVAGADQSRLATFIAVYWLFGAVLTLRWALGSQETAGRRLGVLAAMIGTLAAVAILARKPISEAVGTEVVLDIVGMSALAIGILRILGAFREDAPTEQRPPRRDRVVVGALDACLGIALIVTRDATSPWIRFLVAAWGLAAGTFLVLDALQRRRPRPAR